MPIVRLVPADAGRRRRLKLAVFVVLVLAVVLGGPTLGTLYTDFLWFRSIGYEQVFAVRLLLRLGLGFGGGCLFAGLLYLNLYLAKRFSSGSPRLWFGELGEVYRLDVNLPVARAVVPVSLLAGVLAGVWASQQWQVVLQALHGHRTGVLDALHRYDLSFYFFEMPLLRGIRSLVLALCLVSLLGCVVVYALRGGLSWESRRLLPTVAARRHLSALVASLFLLLAGDAWLALMRLVFSERGPVYGASYADIEAQLPALRLQIAVALAGALLVVINLWARRNLLLLAVLLYAGVEIIGVRAYPSMVQRFRVVPNESVKEATLIRRNIRSTREAYGLAKVSERHLVGEVKLTRADIERNRPTLDNIRLWDHQPLLDTFAQIQEIRTYYEFASVDNDRYIIDGKLSQVMLSPRELSVASLPNRTWINEHFTFTHGYGLTLGPVNRATPEGLPVLFLQDIPPVSATRLRITQPAIYFGELANEYVFVNTKNREFDYPAGENNVYTEYRGRAGVELSSVVTRLALAARTNALKILLSDDIDAQSRILLYRNINERVRRIAPFLTYDRDPYMVVRDNGELVWIQDAYTVSEMYPFSQPARTDTRLNYIRNSVKVVIDAYHGSTNFYVADDTDPLLAAWRRAFPGLFQPLERMPKDLRAHLRYPEDLFRLQTELFATYHMERPELVYNREDQWEIPVVTRGEQVATLEPYFTVMKLPGEDAAEFILMLPFSPKSKDNLAAWMVARMDGEHHGELRIYRFPKDRLVFGPKQIMNRINQDAEISRQISLWDQRGSQAVFGTLLVIPIEESLIYVCPLYLRSSGGRIPELKRVIVVHENRIAMEQSLDLAIAKVFEAELGADAKRWAAVPSNGSGGGSTAVKAGLAGGIQPPAAAERAAAIARLANDAFQRAVTAQRQGDWATYGAELKQVEQALQQLAQP